MRTIVAFPGAGIFAQQVALTLAERGALQAFLTTVAYLPQSGLDSFLQRLGGFFGGRLRGALLRRAIENVPAEFVRTRPFYEVLRTIAHQAGANAILTDRIWDKMARDFDSWVADDYVHKADAVYAYEYTAHETFLRAGKANVAKILDLPSLDSRAYQALLRAEKSRHPELRGRNDDYFEKKFPERQARREAERDMADVIVANSTLTMRSHVKAGADPGKFVVVPLAAPPCIAQVPEPGEIGPLRVIWSGNFSLTKGAHLFLESLRALTAKSAIAAHVYGRVILPSSALTPIVENVRWMGFVPQHVLFSAYEQADVLVFPTLSDGFGMVVLEAFARGLPVITTDQAGAADLVRHRENGLIIPAGDREALSRALEWCLDNRPALYRMRQAALDTAQNWQWPQYRAALADRLSGALRKAGFEPTY